MAYDATETLRALEPPILSVPRTRWWEVLLGLHRHLGPRIYVGRILSHPQWVPLQKRWLEAQAGILTDEEATSLMRDTCRAMGIPWRVMKRLPGAALSEALADFLACQVRASGLRLGPQTTSPSPPGHGSPNGTSRSRASNRIAGDATRP